MNYTDRQRMLFEMVLIAVGLATCFIYWWYDGELRAPSYILFGMAVVAGYIGLWLRFKRSGDTMSPWDIWTPLVDLLVPVILGLFLSLAFIGYPLAAVYVVLAAYAFVVAATWFERRAVTVRRRRAVSSSPTANRR